MEINKNQVINLLSLANVKPSKDYGQNFLIDRNVCEKIANLLITSNEDQVLEIGPGLGSLTHFLSLKDGTLNCVDIDKNMVSILETVYQKKSITFILNDARKIPLEKYTKIIGNLPYNITTELITHLLLNAKNCKQWVFMIQSEAVNRFVETSGKEYGPISVLIHLLGNTKKDFLVKPGSFYPMPKCNSVVFQINRTNQYSLAYASEVYYLAKKLFLNRRKTLLNNLINAVGKNKAIGIVTKLNLNQSIRPEQVSPEMFKNIYDLAK